MLPDEYRTRNIELPILSVAKAIFSIGIENKMMEDVTRRDN
jgi:hypothetical protein